MERHHVSRVLYTKKCDFLKSFTKRLIFLKLQNKNYIILAFYIKWRHIYLVYFEIWMYENFKNLKRNFRPVILHELLAKKVEKSNGPQRLAFKIFVYFNSIFK